MATLQNTPVSLQSKLPPSSPRTQKLLKNLSFNSTFPSLNIASTRNSRSHRSSLGAKMNATAASSYASALVDVAKSNNSIEPTTADMEKVDKLFSDPLVSNFFANPTVGVEKKFQFLDEFAKSSSLQPHTANFLKILVDVKRIDIVKEIVKEFELVYNKLTETELAIVSSVVKLESQHLAQIAKQVQRLTGAKNVRIKTVIDPSLVAGFTIRYGSSGSKLIDMSVKKQLEEIAAQLDLGDIQLAV
ncbi:OSCP domain-containing protein [Cephalotus follicularis]|uniref:OSCP domain-containing protein n=1 Tax=Cephalotus follicularis TaxID=3775 RepID=A0A1Q3CC31_CEPFO|nr:OSCP domain-containing protein [Cephalotus follicularis]